MRTTDDLFRISTFILSLQKEEIKNMQNCKDANDSIGFDKASTKWDAYQVIYNKVNELLWEAIREI